MVIVPVKNYNLKSVTGKFAGEFKSAKGGSASGGKFEISVFTTRPDTLFGAKFMALSPDHPLAQSAAAKNAMLCARPASKFMPAWAPTPRAN